ncbi:hypothetical protein GCM10010289_84860 [Streptomyces violascens]|nr:hypothetical protein GCM10010289_84860 [Streptomyces violascens]
MFMAHAWSVKSPFAFVRPMARSPGASRDCRPSRSIRRLAALAYVPVEDGPEALLGYVLVFLCRTFTAWLSKRGKLPDVAAFAQVTRAATRVSKV